MFLNEEKEREGATREKWKELKREGGEKWEKKEKGRGKERKEEKTREECWEGLSSSKYAKFIDCEYLWQKSIFRKSHLVLNKTTCIHFKSTEMSFVIINIKQ